MREDQLETLEQIMPHGFVIIAAQGDEPRHVKLIMSNRKDNPYLYLIVALIRQFVKNLNDEYGGHDALPKSEA